jgi:hypothetical protein
MLIGSDFNKKCESILREAGKISNQQPFVNISVELLNRELNFSRAELKNYFEYLQIRGLIDLQTIGGPFLYGHISLSKKGISKLKSLQKKD